MIPDHATAQARPPESILARREPREDLEPVFGAHSPRPFRQKLAPDPRVAPRFGGRGADAASFREVFPHQLNDVNDTRMCRAESRMNSNEALKPGHIRNDRSVPRSLWPNASSELVGFDA
jgi:hypothetical protein